MSRHHEGSLPPRYEVMPKDWRQLQGNGTLFTADIATCIGVSIYSPSENKAFLGHFDTSSLEENSSFYPMIEAVSKDFSATESLMTWIGGGEILDPKSAIYGYDEEVITIANDETLAFRKKVLGVVSDLVKQRATLRTTWLSTSASITYSLDVASGIEEIVMNK